MSIDIGINHKTNDIAYSNGKMYIVNGGNEVAQRAATRIRRIKGELANSLFGKSKLAEIKFRKYPLSVLPKKRNYVDFQINDKWKLIINEEIEIDDL